MVAEIRIWRIRVGQAGNSESGEKYLGPRHILKLEPIGLLIG